MFYVYVYRDWEVQCIWHWWMRQVAAPNVCYRLWSLSCCCTYQNPKILSLSFLMWAFTGNWSMCEFTLKQWNNNNNNNNYYYYSIWLCLVTGLFFPVCLLNQRWSPPLTLHASHCSTFRIMCDVPSIAVVCSEYIECFSGPASKFFLKLLVTIQLVLIITGIIVHFRFHIRCILLLLLLLFDMDVFCHRPVLSGTCLEPAVIPTAHTSNFTLQYFPYYVWCSKYSCVL